VSGDRHLLDLGQYKGIVIVNPAEYLRTVSSTTKMPTRKSRVRRQTRR